MVMVKQHLPVVVVALLCIWGYVDLKAEIAGLASPDEAEAVEPVPEAETPEVPAGTAPAPPVVEEQPAPEPKVDWECTGSIEHEKVIETVGKYGQGVFDCYKAALKTDPELSGTLAIEMNVDADGVVREARVKGKLKEPALLGCVGDNVYTWQFPSPVEGDCAVVSVPFLLKPEDHLEGAPPMAAQPPAGQPTP
ncbi:MAG: AgmX/PglI C-terminal domain-containing protein [Deltaproteobacteria bacterium]|nr:AgmX/PglI C-terminal domain-containing protein [Deltaproteobacteria bacterium]